MSWTEQDTKSRAPIPVDQAKALILNEEKRASLPVIRKESENGAPGFDTVKFQPVLSEFFDGEFGAKGKDLIFHFWPANYHAEERAGKVPPRLSTLFKINLTLTMAKHFPKGELQEDVDVGAMSVRVPGEGENMFMRELAIKACENFHNLMAGGYKKR